MQDFCSAVRFVAFFISASFFQSAEYSSLSFFLDSSIQGISSSSKFFKHETCFWELASAQQTASLAKYSFLRKAICSCGTAGGGVVGNSMTLAMKIVAITNNLAGWMFVMLFPLKSLFGISKKSLIYYSLLNCPIDCVVSQRGGRRALF